MKQQKITFYNKRKKFSLKVFKVSWISESVGLMFSGRENAKVLLFNYSKSASLGIHSVFVFFPFIAVWLDKNNSVIDITFVKPFSLHVNIKKNWSRLIEIPINKKNKYLVKFFLDKPEFNKAYSTGIRKV